MKDSELTDRELLVKISTTLEFIRINIEEDKVRSIQEIARVEGVAISAHNKIDEFNYKLTQMKR